MSKNKWLNKLWHTHSTENYMTPNRIHEVFSVTYEKMDEILGGQVERVYTQCDLKHVSI